MSLKSSAGAVQSCKLNDRKDDDMGHNKVKRVVTALIALGLAFFAGVVFSDEIYSAIAVNTTALDDGQQERYREILNKISAIDEVIDTYYMEDDTIDPSLMSEGVYKGYVYGLNEKYTAYYTPEEYKQLLIQSEGVYSGIGVTMSQDMNTGKFVIVEVSENGPGKAASIQAGDVITEVDGESVDGLSSDDVVAKIQGEEGTDVTITIERDGEAAPLEIKVTRQKIDAETVRYEMLENHIGYILLTGFEEVTVKQFNEAVDKLLADGMEGLIVDVRGNPGGNMSSVCPILDRLLPEGLLVYTEDKNGKREEEYADNEEVLDIPMAVITNGSSASAAEIFAAALQDYEWAEIVGEQTYGKGVVQDIIPFSDGSAMKLTSAKYFTPDGRSIHGVGVTPDIFVEAGKDDDTDRQLEAAVKAVEAQLSK